jgi:hypothetical protein
MSIFDGHAERVGALALALALGLALGLGLASCEGCGEPAAATLLSHTGVVERSPAGAPERWEPADDGARFAIGDAARTGESASALLRLRGGGTARLAARTRIRFHLPGVARGRALDVRTGEVTLEADERVALQTALGEAVLEPGTRARLRGGARPGLTVLVGRATVHGEEGPVVLAAGRSMDVAIGRAEVELASGAGRASPPPDRVRVSVRGGDARWWRTGAVGWSSLPDGPHRARPGTRLSLGPDARLTAHRGRARIELRGTGRAVVGREGEPLLSATEGAFRLDGRRERVALRVPGGVIVATFDPARGGSRAEVTVRGDGARVTATEGRVRVVRGDGETWLEAGRALSLGAAASSEALPPRGPRRADLWAEGGDSFWVHAPRVPAVVALSVRGCPGEAILEVGSRRTRGARRVAMALPAGRHDYALRCVGASGGEPVARGRIRVVRDAGRTPVPLRPPTNVVEADGRRYTLLYQNLPPRVVVRWRGAAAPGPYVLEWEGGRGRPRRSPRPRFELPSGALREGRHAFTVRAAGGAVSPRTRLSIRFDNAAPTASIRHPADGAFAAGETVTVAGIAQRGWAVRAEGRALPLDAHHRFRGAVTAPAHRSALAIRLSHPRRGVHYYLRRARGETP